MASSTKKRKRGATSKTSARYAAETQSAPRPTYEIWDRDIPHDPTVRIVFHGLLSFFFDGKRACRVGIPNTTQDRFPQHRHKHDFDVKLWAITGAPPEGCVRLPLIPDIKNPKLIDGVTIKVSGESAEAGVDGVYVFQDPRGFSEPPPPPAPAGNHDNDWRWVVDFESDLLYPEGVKNIKAAVNPHIVINNGLFYTLKKTDEKFNFVLRPQGGGDTQLRSLAEIVAANIYLGKRGKVEVTVHPLQTISLPAGHGVKYQIDITNNCGHGGAECKFNPKGSSKEDRNDFYLYYETFEKPADKPEYELICTNCEARTVSADADEDAKKSREELQKLGICGDGRIGPRSTHEAPCGPSGHGQSTTPAG